MLRWTAHLRARDRFGAPASWAALTALPTFPDGTTGGYALGLMIEAYRGVRTVSHAGGVFGGTSQMLSVPDHGLDVVVLANGGPGANTVRLAEQVVDIILADHLTPQAPRIAAADHAALAGLWWSAETEMLYGLRDEDGALTLTFCGGLMGIPLLPLSGGRALARAGSIGDIAVALEGAAPDGELTIAFGGRAGAYRKVSKKTADPAAFAEAVVGRYHSDDGDCDAIITRSGEIGDRLKICFAEPYGRIEVDLTCLGESVAVTSSASGMHAAALSFSRDGATMSGFRLNSARTRGLAFGRI